MATDVVHTKEFNMGMDEPPPYKAKDRTRLYITAVTVIVVAILVGFFGVFYLLLSSSAPTIINTVTNQDQVTDDTEPSIIEVGIDFQSADGTEHYERVTLDGETLTITNTGDDYIVVLDYKRNILVARNLSTTRCFFADLEEIGNMDTKDMDSMKSVYYEEVLPGGDPVPSHPSIDQYNFLQIPDPIPSGYVNLTNSDIVVDLCGSGESFWMQPMAVPAMRARRQILPPVTELVLWRVCPPCVPCNPWSPCPPCPPGPLSNPFA